MKDVIDPVRGMTHGVLAAQVAFHDLYTVCERREALPLTSREVVEHTDLLSATEELFDQVRADKPATASYKKQCHRGRPP
jgi:hypothetical protein